MEIQETEQGIVITGLEVYCGQARSLSGASLAGVVAYQAVQSQPDLRFSDVIGKVIGLDTSPIRTIMIYVDIQLAKTDAARGFLEMARLRRNDITATWDPGYGRMMFSIDMS